MNFNFLRNLENLLSIYFVIIIILILLSLPLFIIAILYKKKKISIIVIVINFIIFIFFIILYNITLNFIKEELYHSLNKINNKNCYIVINEKLIVDSNNYLQEILKFKNIPAHHSHVKNKINVKFISEENYIEIILGRDSKINNEYWIYYPRYNLTKSKEIGRIQTNLFDNF